MKISEIILILLVILFSFFAGYYCNENIIYRNINKTVIDTMFIEKYSVPIIIKEIQPKLLFRSDTIIVTAPFVAQVDTIYKCDTIRIDYRFPENIMNLEIFPKPDSIEIRNIYITKEICKSNNWWEIPSSILSGVIMGYIIGKNGD